MKMFNKKAIGEYLAGEMILPELASPTVSNPIETFTNIAVLRGEVRGKVTVWAF